MAKDTPPKKPAKKKVTPKKNKGGRPTKYNASVEAVMMKLATEGAGIVEIAHELGVDRSTIYYWKDNHPEFSAIFGRAREACQAWWEKQGRKGLSDRNFNAALYKMNMVNRFPEDWKDKREVEHSGKLTLEDLVAGDGDG
jgi:transposase-like protein